MGISCLSMACPKLAGSYSCEDIGEDGVPFTFVMDITQTKERGVDIYKVDFNGETQFEAKADGRTHKIEDGTEKASCRGRKLIYRLSLPTDGMELKMDNILSKKGDKLTYLSDVIAYLGNTKIYSNKNTVNCEIQ